MHVIKDFMDKIKTSMFSYLILIIMIILLITVGVMRENHRKKVSEKIDNNKEVQTVNTNGKNYGKVIVIDPGHGSKSDMSSEPLAPGSNKKRVKSPIGAIGTYTKTPEYKVDWDVALKLKKVLEDKGLTVIMTKNNIDENPSGTERADVGNKADARLVVRIHADSYKDQTAYGTSILAPGVLNSSMESMSVESNRCANIILSVLTNEVGVKDRGVVVRKDLTAFNWSNVPTLLIELGFLSNRNEELLLISDQYQSKLAQAIADGVEEAVKTEWNK